MAFVQNFDAVVNMISDFQVEIKLYKERVNQNLNQVALGLKNTGSWAFEFALPQLREMQTLYDVIGNTLGPDWYKLLQFKRGRYHSMCTTSILYIACARLSALCFVGRID